MEKAKNIIEKVICYLKENIQMEENGMEIYMMQMEIFQMNMYMED